ncbi:hypothetical protein HY837_03900 [archaeon]|nr:hypothetical protein [archaeon]
MITENKSSEDFVVLVGVHPNHYPEQWGEREELAQKISDAGFKVQEVPVSWPRDHYVFTRGRYVIEKKHGEAGEGGCFNFCDDFVLVSNNVFRDKSDKLAIKEKIQPFYPKQRVHVIPAGCDPSIHYRDPDHILDHTDLTSLLIHSKKLLFVDESFYDDVYTFENIAYKEELCLVRYASHVRSCNFYALNCLVLPKNGREIVFANRNTPYFVNLLRKYGLEVVEVNMSIAPREKQGSIRCCTNTKKPETPLEELLDFKQP